MSNSSQPLTGIDLATAGDLAAQFRVDSVRSSTSAGSGHPTSSMSAADLLAVLVGRHLRYDWDNPRDDRNDHLIFSKGHASPLLYSVYRAVGVVSEEELMTGYRRFGSRLEGHPGCPCDRGGDADDRDRRPDPTSRRPPSVPCVQIRHGLILAPVRLAR